MNTKLRTGCADHATVRQSLADSHAPPTGHGLHKEQKPEDSGTKPLSLMSVYFVELLKLCMYLHITSVCLCVCLTLRR